MYFSEVEPAGLASILLNDNCTEYILFYFLFKKLQFQERQGGSGSGGGGGGRVPDGIRNRMFGGEGGMDESTYSVPADKCGLVIGKGSQFFIISL